MPLSGSGWCSESREIALAQVITVPSVQVESREEGTEDLLMASHVEGDLGIDPCPKSFDLHPVLLPCRTLHVVK
jgi:hypothetical protein